MSQRLTREQAAIIGAYTGVTAGPYADVCIYAGKVLGRQVWNHAFTDEATATELRQAARADFLAITFVEEEPTP